MATPTRQIIGIGSYVTVLEPKPDMKGKLKYSITILIPKSLAPSVLKEIRADALVAAKDKWGAKGEAILKAAKNPMIQDGDTYVPQSGEPDPSYKGHFFIRMRSDRKPGVIDAKKQPVFTTDDIYSGCLVRVSGNVFAYEAEGNRGVSFGLGNVQVLEKRARLDGRKAAEDEFSEWAPESQGGNPDPMS